MLHILRCYVIWMKGGIFLTSLVTIIVPSRTPSVQIHRALDVTTSFLLPSAFRKGRYYGLITSGEAEGVAERKGWIAL